MTKLSLLCNNDIPYGTIGDQTISHLSIDRLFEPLKLDSKTCTYLISVLSKPVIDADTIRYRQDILRDFLRYPKLLDRLCEFYTRFDALHREHESARRERVRAAHSGGTGLGATKNLLQSAALILKRALLLSRELSALLSEFNLNSQGLNNLCAAIRPIAQADAAEQLLHLCTRFEDPINGRLDYQVTFDRYGKISSSALIPEKKQAAERKTRHSFLRKRTSNTMPGVPIDLFGSRLYDTLAADPLVQLAEALDTVTRGIISLLAPIGKELSFYHAAQAYCNAVKATGAPLIFPEITEDAPTAYTALYDPLLLLAYGTHDKVVPNDIERSANGGMIIFGANSSGKTVFARAIGTVQLLAQAGLPISANAARIRISTQIVTHFAQAEKDFTAGNEAGRFEQECSRVADTLDHLRPGALILLNEIFQSTAYEEGARGLEPILRYLTRERVDWILVSHLHALRGILTPDDATFYHMENGYKLQQGHA